MYAPQHDHLIKSNYVRIRNKDNCNTPSSNLQPNHIALNHLANLVHQ